jgi:transcriptional regulator with XRE-family HTH domain
MLARTPDPLDVMVGTKIRIFRTDRGMSQSELAGQIGVAFQQVQKYEKGINRVGASRLSRIAAVLGITVGELFESSKLESPKKSAGSRSAGSNSPFRLLAEPDALRVLKAFSRTTDPHVRRAIARLVESVADRETRVKSPTLRAAAVKPRERRRAISSK